MGVLDRVADEVADSQDETEDCHDQRYHILGDDGAFVSFLYTYCRLF
jgi:hypothetical protein